MIRHLYQRTITHKGKKTKAWYYWFYDEDGKQVRRSCGQNGKPCFHKREAEAFLASLGNNHEKRQTLAELVTGLFDADSEYVTKLRLKGKDLADHTLCIKQKLLEKILKKYGNRYPEEISIGEIDSWLLTFDRSNSWRNQVLGVFREIYRNLFEFKKIDTLPFFQNFCNNDRKTKGILSFEEIKRLFPNDYNEIVKIWRWNSKAHEPDWQVFVLATMIFTTLSTGMRRGEARALKYSQFVSDNAILINCRLDQSNREITRLKKGTDENKKWRVSILPQKTVDMIRFMTENKRELKPSRYLFTFHGHPWGGFHLNSVLKEVLRKNGIDADARNITMHSLRFTYNTIMKSKIDNVDLRLMLGHVQENMTEYYDRSKALDHLEELQHNKNIIDGVWN